MCIYKITIVQKRLKFLPQKHRTRDFFFVAEKCGKEKTVNRSAILKKLPVGLADYCFPPISAENNKIKTFASSAP
jgi:hypothetical protein